MAANAGGIRSFAYRLSRSRHDRNYKPVLPRTFHVPALANEDYDESFERSVQFQDSKVNNSGDRWHNVIDSDSSLLGPPIPSLDAPRGSSYRPL